MCFNIIFRNKAFPQTDVGSNENMKKMGIRCMREEDDERFSKTEGGKKNGATCSFTRRITKTSNSNPRESRYQVLKR